MTAAAVQRTMMRLEFAAANQRNSKKSDYGAVPSIKSSIMTSTFEAVGTQRSTFRVSPANTTANLSRLSSLPETAVREAISKLGHPPALAGEGKNWEEFTFKLVAHTATFSSDASALLAESSESPPFQRSVDQSLAVMTTLNEQDIRMIFCSLVLAFDVGSGNEHMLEKLTSWEWETMAKERLSRPIVTRLHGFNGWGGKCKGQGNGKDRSTVDRKETSKEKDKGQPPPSGNGSGQQGDGDVKIEGYCGKCGK
eukprot:16416-Amphidinium_carterae.4